MLTTEQLKTMQHPILRASQTQEHINALEDDIAAKKIEYNQIILFCREANIKSQDGFTIKVKSTTRRSVDPGLFAKRFPEENALMVSKYAAYIGTELDNLVTKKLLPSISVEEAKKYVGDVVLNEVCTISVSEKVTIVKEKEE